MADKYDEAVAYLTEHPDETRTAWRYPESHVAGCLFRYATETGGEYSFVSDDYCGCLTQIHCGDRFAVNDDVTEAIRSDQRIPNDVSNSMPRETLEVFAEWQRRLDREIRTPAPRMTPTEMGE